MVLKNNLIVKNMKKNYGIVLMFLIVASGIKCAAQDNSKSLLKQVIQNNQETVDAIAMYPTETRKIIFEATEYPELIVKLNSMQKSSQDAFESLISSFSKDEQEKLWNLTRYDGLISDLVADHKKSVDEINNILVNYPEEIHKTALDEQQNNYDLLVQIDKMNKGYNSDFGLLLSGYSPEVASVFGEMIKMPDVLNMLFDNMQYTVVVGDYYKKNPERILHKTDSLNLVLTQKNQQETNDWKQSMADDPQSQQEYVQAAQEYAQDNGYQPDDYNVPLTQDVTNYNTNPYNWWFGYPSWYPYDYWNPYPYWYDWGFYYGPGGHVVFFGLPSEYFMKWFFYYPDHFSRYAELSNHYYNYYDMHRGSINNNSISHNVGTWRTRNSGIITDSWDRNASGRTQMFKEYGQMETDRQKYNTKNPQHQIEQSEFLQKKQGKYPTLSVNVPENQSVQRNPGTKSVRENVPEPVRKPAILVPDRYKVPVTGQVNKQPEQNRQNNNNNIQTGNVNAQQPVRVNPQLKSPVPQKPAENSNQIRNARQYQENTWQQIQSQPRTQQVQQSRPQNSAPAARQQVNSRVEQPVRQSSPAPSNNNKKR
jgi:hypothetical protein